MRVKTLATAIVVMSALIARTSTAEARDDRLVRWANAILTAFDAGGDERRWRAARTSANDHFGRTAYAQRVGRPELEREALASGGRTIETAGSGSLGVYDPVHHIAALSSGGDVDGDYVAYATAPPIHLPRRDLADVRSAAGLRLGMTSRDASARLGISVASIRRLGHDRSILWARRPRRCGAFACAHDTLIVFRHDRAVAIMLADIAP